MRTRELKNGKTDSQRYMKEQIYFVTKSKDSLTFELYSLADFPEVRYETAKVYEFYMKGILGGTASLQKRACA